MAPATLVSLARVGIAGLSLASLLNAEEHLSPLAPVATASLPDAVPALSPSVATATTTASALPQRVRAAV